MNLSELELDYWETQVARVESIRSRIAARSDVISDGRCVPSEDSLSSGMGKRLFLAVLFIDIVNSSKRPCESAAEQSSALRAYDLFFTEMIRIAEEYDGTVEKNTGDGLMAYFSDEGPNISGHAAQKCLSSVLTMWRINKRKLSGIYAASNMPEICFRAGLDYGPVTIAQIGAARRFGSRVAIGTTANVACKMLEGTEEGIYIGENILRHIPSNWAAHAVLHKEQTGYTFEQSGSPYRFFEFTGGWKDPA